MFKKIVSVLLVITTLFCYTSVFASEGGAECKNPYTSKTAEITNGYKNGTEFENGFDDYGLPYSVQDFDEVHEFITLYANIKMYAPDGRMEYVPPKDVEAWKSVGWYDYPVTTMYAPDGRSAVIATSLAEAWKNVGWYNYPVTTMYALDGRSAVVAISEVEAWKNVGWYMSPVKMMYAPDGRTNIVPTSEVEAWKSVGWYDYPVTTMYALDGRSAVVPTSSVEAWKSVGWYDFPVNEPDVFFDKVVMREGMYDTESYVRHHSKLGFVFEYPTFFNRSYTADTLTLEYGGSYLKIKKYNNRSMESVRKELIGNLKLAVSEYEIDGKTVYSASRSKGYGFQTDIYTYRFVYNGDTLYVITTYLPTIEYVEGIGYTLDLAVENLDFH